MTKLQCAWIASALICACGCTQGTPGGPGVAPSASSNQNQTANKPVINESKDTFSLRTPALSTSVKQGESKSATIAISRGSTFDEDVQLSFTDLPTGVTIDPDTATLKKDDKEVKLNVMASENAAVGDFTAHVVGHPMKTGADAKTDFKISVTAK
jgi:hypothetical protein